MKKSTQKGFSLLELIAVMAAVAVMLAVAVVSASNILPSFRATSGMNQVMGVIRRARHAALSDRRTISINFIGNNQIQLLTNPPGGGVATPLDGPIPYTLEGGVQFLYFPATGDTPMGFGACPAATCFTNPANPGGGLPATTFLADGTFGAGIGVPVNGTIFLGIPNKPTTARAITILGATGRIRTYYWDGNAWQE
jgi:prepilin-type N-terminal cleavage/methylation domain-containing protein